MSRGLHVSVISAEDGQTDWTPTVRLMKTALLYADRVQLRIILPILKLTDLALGAIQLSDRSPRQSPPKNPSIEAWDREIELAADPDNITAFDEHPTVENERETTPHTGLALDTSNLVMESPEDSPFVTQALQRGLAAPTASLGEMARIWRSDLVSPISVYVHDPLDMSKSGTELTLDNEQRFVASVSRAIASGLTFPLVDGRAAKLLTSQRSKVNSSRTSDSETALEHGTAAVYLAQHLFERLPYFDNAPVDELLDIRSELARPLVRFRAHLMRAAASISGVPWEQGVANECERIVLMELAPAVAELEDEVKSRSFLRILARKMADHPWQTSGLPSLGLALTKIADIPSLVSLGLAVAPLTASALHEWFEASDRSRRNTLFYYTSIKERLSDRN